MWAKISGDNIRIRKVCLLYQIMKNRNIIFKYILSTCYNWSTIDFSSEYLNNYKCYLHQICFHLEKKPNWMLICKIFDKPKPQRKAHKLVLQYRLYIAYHSNNFWNEDCSFPIRSSHVLSMSSFYIRRNLSTTEPHTPESGLAMRTWYCPEQIMSSYLEKTISFFFIFFSFFVIEAI